MARSSICGLLVSLLSTAARASGDDANAAALSVKLNQLADDVMGMSM